MCGRSFTVLTLVLRGLMNPAISLVRNVDPLAVELISATHGSQVTYVRSRTALFVYPVCICGFYVLVPASHDVRAVSPFICTNSASHVFADSNLQLCTVLSYCTEPLLHINDTLFARDDHRMNLVGVSGRARPRHNLEKDL